MADLQSMTLTERMNTINSDGLQDYTFQEACNKWLSDNSPINGTAYSANYNKYTPEEAFAIIRYKIDLRSETLNALVSELGSYYPIYKYTATEALNKKNAVLVPYSLSFDGVNDYVQTENMTIGTNFSLSIWFYADAVATNRTLLASSHYYTVGKDGNFSISITDATHITFASYDGQGAGESGAFPVSTLNTGTWYNVVFACAGDDKLFLYINGVSNVPGSMNHTKDLSDLADGGLVIGEDLSGTNNAFDGKIDEVALFNRKLTQAEITSIYAAAPPNASGAVTPGINNLVGYWKFDEGTGEPQDASGNGNHGTITGATWTVH